MLEGSYIVQSGVLDSRSHVIGDDVGSHRGCSNRCRDRYVAPCHRPCPLINMNLHRSPPAPAVVIVVLHTSAEAMSVAGAISGLVFEKPIIVAAGESDDWAEVYVGLASIRPAFEIDRSVG